jgi:hypothetical protein
MKDVLKILGIIVLAAVNGSDGGEGGWALATFKKGDGGGVFTEIFHQ